MFSTRITRKALSIMAITLLAAGTAAAAAGGALPMFQDQPTEIAVEAVEVADDAKSTVGGDDSSSNDAPPSNDDGSESPSNDDGSESPTSAADASEGDADLKGKCTAWTSGAAKSADNPAFAELQIAADAAAEKQRIDEYCADQLTPGNNGNGNGNNETKPGNNGNGNNETKPGNNGNGNNETGNGNGNNGNGNNETGNGNGNNENGNGNGKSGK